MSALPAQAGVQANGAAHLVRVFYIFSLPPFPLDGASRMQVAAGLCGVRLCTSPGCIGVHRAMSLFKGVVFLCRATSLFVVRRLCSSHLQGGMGCVPVGGMRTRMEIDTAKCQLSQ